MWLRPFSTAGQCLHERKKLTFFYFVANVWKVGVRRSIRTLFALTVDGKPYTIAKF